MKKKPKFTWKHANMSERTSYTLRAIKTADEAKLVRIAQTVTSANVGKRGFKHVLDALAKRGMKLGL